MRRGELYRVFRPSRDDTRRSRVFVIVSRPAFIQSRASTVLCAPVYTAYHELESQVVIGVDEGLKQPSAIHCDALVSNPAMNGGACRWLRQPAARAAESEPQPEAH